MVELHLEGEDAPLCATAGHKLFSEDRQAWVSAGELKVGERLRTRSGPRQVLAIKLLPGGRRVYNLEVQSRHSYYVGQTGLLVHNGCPIDRPGPGYRQARVTGGMAHAKHDHDPPS